MRRLGVLDWVALALVLVGGLNWGLVGIFGFDLVAAIFGEMSVFSRIVYSLVGAAAVYVAAISYTFTRGAALRIAEEEMPGGRRAA